MNPARLHALFNARFRISGAAGTARAAGTGAAGRPPEARGVTSLEPGEAPQSLSAYLRGG